MSNGYMSSLYSALPPPQLSSEAAPAPPFGTFSGDVPPPNAAMPLPPGATNYNAMIAGTLGGSPPPPGAPAPPLEGAPPPPSPGAPPPPPGPIGPPNDAAPAGGPAPSSFLQRVHGAMSGTTPAHEVEMRGPQLKAAQGERNVAMEGAIAAVTERSQQTAAGDYALALETERKAGIREDAANYSAAERANELAERQADFDASTKALSKQSVDPGRFWSNANVATKLLALISVTLGGFVQGKTGRSNVGMDNVNQMIDRDIKAQEFAYNAARDTVNAKQTAFSMAMQKYNNVDAARAAARAAALDAASATIGQQAALWKGTDAANRAQMAMGELAQDRANQIQQGVAFVPAKTVSVGAQYVDPRTGLTYSEAEAKGLAAKLDDREFKREEKGMDVAGQVLVEDHKAGAKGGKDDQKQIDAETRAISAQLQQAGVPMARANAELALKALNKSEGGKGEAALRAVLYDGPARAVLSDDANAREDAYNDFMNAAIKATAGNATASEEVRVVRSMGSTGDPKGRKRAIERVLNALAEVEKGAKAGASPEAQAEYDRRRSVAQGAPPAAPKGSKAGW